MIVGIIIAVAVFLVIFGIMYWLADKVDKEDAASKALEAQQLQEWEDYQRQCREYYGPGSVGWQWDSGFQK